MAEENIINLSFGRRYNDSVGRTLHGPTNQNPNLVYDDDDDDVGGGGGSGGCYRNLRVDVMRCLHVRQN